MTQLELAQDLFQRGAFSQAADTLLQSGKPGSLEPSVQLLLGVALARSHRDAEAVSVLESLLQDLPDTYEALTWMAILTKRDGDGKRAVTSAERAIQLKPNDAKGYSVLGACHQYHRRIEPALVALKKAAALEPGVAEHQHNLGLLYQIIQDHREARVCFQRAISLAPRNPQSYVALADDYSTYGSPKGFSVLQHGLTQIPASPALHSEMGKMLTKLHKDEEAELHFQQSVKLSPAAKGPYASWLLDQGRFDEAASLYQAMIQERPVQGVGYYGLGLAGKLDTAGQVVKQMEALRGHASMGAFEQMHLRYALGRVEERRGEYERAMSDFEVANRLAYGINIQGSPFGMERFASLHEAIRNSYERIRRTTLEGDPTEIPVFIVGMVRSGTTLLDQILSSHSSVASAGEIRYWIESLAGMIRRQEDIGGSKLKELVDSYLSSLEWLAGKANRITDKMPMNFAYCGLIHKAMPNARFIHLRRHPVDTCLSIYTTYFGPGAPFAYRPENIVAYYREYQRMMEFWAEAIPEDRLITVDYEVLVSDRERTIRRLLEFCDLPWDEACLHHEKNAKPILSPSRWQARQPLYTSSVGRWRNYEPWLGPFASLLSA